MAVSLVKTVRGTVHISLFGSAQDDKARALDCARASFHSIPAARLAITAVSEEPAYRTLRAGTRMTVTAY